ncbi:MAG: glycosyltransferase family 2 protein [Candidatus Dormibacteria bacterium]
MPTPLRKPGPDGVSAVLPAYNEEAVIAATVRQTHAVLASLELAEFEVLVVDDGSRDGTRAECERVASELGGVRVLTHDTNQGYGSALRTGFDAATCDAVFLMDSDGQFDPAQLGLLLDHWDGNTVVCGYRAHRSDPFPRRAYNRAFFAIVDARFGHTVRDVNCGFKLFPRAVGTGLTSEGALISTELLVRARDNGYRFADVAVSHAPRLTGTPTGANPRVVLRAFRELRDLDQRRRHAPRAERPSDDVNVHLVADAGGRRRPHDHALAQHEK